MSKLTVTFDGLAGTGKTTLARQVAKRLQCIHLSAGTMYRLITWLLCKEHLILQLESDAVANIIKSVRFSVNLDGLITINSHNVEQDILRSDYITLLTIAVSKIPKVRTRVSEELVRFSEQKSVVADGRDIAKKVFPNANYKFYFKQKKHSEDILKSKFLLGRDLIDYYYSMTSPLNKRITRNLK